MGELRTLATLPRPVQEIVLRLASDWELREMLYLEAALSNGADRQDLSRLQVRWLESRKIIEEDHREQLGPFHCRIHYRLGERGREYAEVLLNRHG